METTFGRNVETRCLLLARSTPLSRSHRSYTASKYGNKQDNYHIRDYLHNSKRQASSEIDRNSRIDYENIKNYYDHVVKKTSHQRSRILNDHTQLSPCIARKTHDRFDTKNDSSMKTFSTSFKPASSSTGYSSDTECNSKYFQSMFTPDRSRLNANEFLSRTKERAFFLNSQLAQIGSDLQSDSRLCLSRKPQLDYTSFGKSEQKQPSEYSSYQQYKKRINENHSSEVYRPSVTKKYAPMSVLAQENYNLESYLSWKKLNNLIEDDERENITEPSIKTTVMPEINTSRHVPKSQLVTRSCTLPRKQILSINDRKTDQIFSKPASIQEDRVCPTTSFPFSHLGPCTRSSDQQTRAQSHRVHVQRAKDYTNSASQSAMAEKTSEEVICSLENALVSMNEILKSFAKNAQSNDLTNQTKLLTSLSNNPTSYTIKTLPAETVKALESDSPSSSMSNSESSTFNCLTSSESSKSFFSSESSCSSKASALSDKIWLHSKECRSRCTDTSKIKQPSESLGNKLKRILSISNKTSK